MPKRITAALVATAIAALPWVLDRCSETCEMHKVEATTAPSCHHATSSATHIGHVPVPCGHDHHVVVVTAATIARMDSSLVPIAMVEPAREPLVGATLGGRPLSESPPVIPSTFRSQSLPLRV